MIDSIISQLRSAISEIDTEIAYAKEHYPPNGYSPDQWGMRMTADRYARFADTTALEKEKQQLQSAIVLLLEQERRAIESACKQHPDLAPFIRNPAMAGVG
jgi:hypothetical protein